MEAKKGSESDGRNASKEERSSGTDMTQTIEIARGSFGRILVALEALGLAFKQPLNPGDIEQLQKEFDIYRLAVAPLKKATFRVPKPSKFYPSVAALQARYDVKVESAGPLFRLDSDTFIAKRQRAAFMNTTNYPLCSKDIEFLQAQGALSERYTCSSLAVGMGEVLAAFHHELKLDARDIEFVLGGSDKHDDDLASLWVLDFNQVKPWQTVDDLVSAHLANDPYYPRPGTEFWNMFVAGYLTRSIHHVEEANAFIKALVDKERSKAPASVHVIHTSPTGMMPCRRIVMGFSYVDTTEPQAFFRRSAQERRAHIFVVIQ